MKRYKFSTLKRIVDRYGRKKILVVGDLLLDQYVEGKVSRISPEAPVPVLWARRERYVPGGACNVACNLASLGARVSLVGVVGGMPENDGRTAILKGLLRERGIGVDGLVTDKTRKTILKTRVMADHHPHHQQIVRIDREDLHPISPATFREIKRNIISSIKEIDAVIIEDYGKGLITSRLLKEVIGMARAEGKLIAVDPKENHFSYYRNISVITPNRYEAEKAVGFPLADRDALHKGGYKLLRDLNADVVLITLGEEGMMVFRRDREPAVIPTLAREVFDVSGAGDAVIGVYTLSRVSGADILKAAHMANCAAGIVVSHTGTAPVAKTDLINELKERAGRR
ncbi:MAG: D-glycero-beta-D-manno-heptose-7-phosphate kinase [Candidatus Omnitrophica bacterium]|nr:D-glycero-beta-D-manno-heptose-7-phosphate kinase [Candidatus Omnitrophota bacterium]